MSEAMRQAIVSFLQNIHQIADHGISSGINKILGRRHVRARAVRTLHISRPHFFHGSPLGAVLGVAEPAEAHKSNSVRRSGHIVDDTCTALGSRYLAAEAGAFQYRVQHKSNRTGSAHPVEYRN